MYIQVGGGKGGYSEKRARSFQKYLSLSLSHIHSLSVGLCITCLPHSVRTTVDAAASVSPVHVTGKKMRFPDVYIFIIDAVGGIRPIVSADAMYFCLLFLEEIFVISEYGFGLPFYYKNNNVNIRYLNRIFL